MYCSNTKKITQDHTNVKKNKWKANLVAVLIFEVMLGNNSGNVCLLLKLL